MGLIILLACTFCDRTVRAQEIGPGFFQAGTVPIFPVGTFSLGTYLIGEPLELVKISTFGPGAYFNGSYFSRTYCSRGRHVLAWQAPGTVYTVIYTYSQNITKQNLKFIWFDLPPAALARKTKR